MSGAAVALRHNNEIGRFEIAMNHPGSMCRLEPGCRLCGQLESCRNGQRTSTELLCQGLPGHQLHHQESRSTVIPGTVELENARDMVVFERCQKRRFALEAQQPLRLGGYIVRQNLDRDLALQKPMSRPVDLSHTARTERRENLVLADGASGSEPHRVAPNNFLDLRLEG